MADTALLCGFCYLPFNAGSRMPLAMPNCVHTVCSQCVFGVPEQPRAPRVPDNEDGQGGQGGEGEGEGQEGGAGPQCLVCRKPYEGKPHARLGVLHAARRAQEEGQEGEREEAAGSARQCQACPDQQHPATHHCAECNEDLCEAVLRLHNRYNPAHTVTELAGNRVGRGAELFPPSPSVCPSHNQPIAYVCNDDGQLVCHKCAVGQHRGHKFDTPADVVRGKVEDLRALVGEVEGKARELGEGAGKMKEERDMVFAAIAEAEADVKAFFDEVFKIRTSLLTKLYKAKKCISQQHTDMVTTAKALQHAAHHARAVIEAREQAVPSFGIAAAVQQLRDQLEACKRDVGSKPLVLPPVKFVHPGLSIDELRSNCDVTFGHEWKLEWDVVNSHPNRQADINGPTVRVSNVRDWFYVIGKQTIPANSTSKFHFTIRADSLPKTADLVVGVTTLEKAPAISATNAPGNCWAWTSYGDDGLYANGSKSGSTSAQAKAGSALTVIVEPAAGTLKFLLDGAQVGALSYPGNQVVRPVMSLFYVGAQATVVESFTVE